MGVIILILVIHLSQLRGTLPQSLRDSPLKEGAIGNDERTKRRESVFSG